MYVSYRRQFRSSQGRGRLGPGWAPACKSEALLHAFGTWRLWDCSHSTEIVSHPIFTIQNGRFFGKCRHSKCMSDFDRLWLLDFSIFLHVLTLQNWCTNLYYIYRIPSIRSRPSIRSQRKLVRLLIEGDFYSRATSIVSGSLFQMKQLLICNIYFVKTMHTPLF